MAPPASALPVSSCLSPLCRMFRVFSQAPPALELSGRRLCLRPFKQHPRGPSLDAWLGRDLRGRLIAPGRDTTSRALPRALHVCDALCSPPKSLLNPCPCRSLLAVLEGARSSARESGTSAEGGWCLTRRSLELICLLPSSAVIGSARTLTSPWSRLEREALNGGDGTVPNTSELPVRGAQITPGGNSPQPVADRGAVGSGKNPVGCFLLGFRTNFETGPFL